MITIEFIVILLCLLTGTRFGGMGLGLISGIGLFILCFVFGLQPGKPPVDVMLTILAVIGCAATLQTAGGLNVMMQFAERLLRKHPQHITLLAPFTTWMLTFLHHVPHHCGYRPEKRDPTRAPNGRGIGSIADGNHGITGFRRRRVAGLHPGRPAWDRSRVGDPGNTRRVGSRFTFWCRHCCPVEFTPRERFV